MIFICLISRSSGQIRNTFNKARTLCDKWRGSGGIGGSPRLSLDGSLAGDVSPQNQANQGRLSRWFSIRRGSPHQYVIENPETPPPNSNKMPLLPEVGILAHKYLFRLYIYWQFKGVTKCYIIRTRDSFSTDSLLD